MLDRVPRDFGGGCSVRKAYVLASLIKEYRLKSSVDIGVYRGRSLFPQLVAHRDFSGGVVYGVDPWSAEEARESESEMDEKISNWLKETDFEDIFRSVSALKTEFERPGRRSCVLLRETSARAAEGFRTSGTKFGLVHVDGNHDTERVMEDLELYLPLLEPGGFVVLDDVSWASVRPAYEKMRAETRLVLERTLPEDDYAVFWLPNNPDDFKSVQQTVWRAATA